jgi:membrane dipeptidase
MDKFMARHVPQFMLSMEPIKLGERSKEGCVDLPRLMEGGIDCQLFAIYVEQAYTPEKALRRTMEMLDAFYQSLEENMDRLALALSHDDIIKASKEGKVAAVLSIEGGEAIEGSLSALRMLYRLGVRAMGLTHSPRNLLADGNRETRAKGGLTNLGVQVVEEMNKLGMIVDVSHLNEQGFWDVVQVCKGPLIASHSNVWSLCKVGRNLKDDQIRAIAEKRGVMGVNFVARFLEKEGKATIETLLDHIDYVANLIGPDHVGLGSDFDGGGRLPELEDCSKMPNITRGLVKRGYSDEDIKKILGGNFLRVFKQVLK